MRRSAPTPNIPGTDADRFIRIDDAWKMTSLMQEMGARAQRLGIPLGAQLDLTYRCNERCVHCYLDHDDHGEMSFAEIKDLLDQLAAAGVFFLTISGGEIFLRPDLFDILEHARGLMFSVKIKT